MNAPMKKLWTSVIFPPNPQTRKLLACLSAGSGGQSRALTRPGRPGRRTRGRKHTRRPGAWPRPLAVPGGCAAGGLSRCFPAQELVRSNGLYGRTVLKTPNGDLSVVLPEELSGFKSPHLSNEHLLVGI